MSSRFEKLVKLVGTQLTPHIYNFITYVQVGTKCIVEEIQCLYVRESGGGWHHITCHNIYWLQFWVSGVQSWLEAVLSVLVWQ